jgi:hypothetical protein
LGGITDELAPSEKAVTIIKLMTSKVYSIIGHHFHGLHRHLCFQLALQAGVTENTSRIENKHIPVLCQYRSNIGSSPSYAPDGICRSPTRFNFTEHITGVEYGKLLIGPQHT